ncbi:MAG: hypothetical protein J0M12_17850, partial [Deltaproteobacteria bacterium]|nr:hypothetical protein [Deltaproteobacteria bacterium]
QEVDEGGFPIQAIRRFDGSAILKFRAAESQAIMTSINSYRILVGKKQYAQPVVMSARGPVRTLESMLCSPLRNGQTLYSYADISINDQNEILTEVVGGEHLVAQPVILHPRYTSIQSGGAIKPSSLD